MALGNAGVPARTVPNLLHLLFRNQFSRCSMRARRPRSQEPLNIRTQDLKLNQYQIIPYLDNLPLPIRMSFSRRCGRVAEGGGLLNR